MSITRTRMIVIGLIALMQSLWLGPVNQATAATTSCGPLTNIFDGVTFNDSAHSARGAAAQIKIKAPALCGNSNIYSVFSSAWVGIQSSDATGLVQIGYMRNTYNATHTPTTEYFLLWTNNFPSSFNSVRWGNPAYNSVHEFKVTYNWTTHLAHMYLDQTIPNTCADTCPVTNFDPVAEWPSPIWALHFGEVDHKGNDMPGISSSKETFDVANVRWPDTNWYATLAYSGDLHTDYSCAFQYSTSSVTSFQIYTDPVSHSGCP